MTAVAAGKAGTLRRPVDDLIPAQVGTRSLSPTELAVARLKENRIFHVAVAIFSAILLMCALTPVMETSFSGHRADEQNLSGHMRLHGKKTEIVSLRGIPNVGPGFHKQYMLGADQLGRDVFMRTLRGGKVSLLAGFGGAFMSMFLATLLGTLAGYKRGKWDTIISRYFDFMLSFPMLLLMVALGTALATRESLFGFIHRGSLSLVLLLLGIGGIPSFGRLIRSQVLSLSEKEFVEAAKAMGGGDRRVMIVHLLPNISSALVTYFGLLVSSMILAEVGLAYLGVGILPPNMSWGTGISDGVMYYTTAWWITIVPGAFVTLTVLSINLIGIAIEEAFDPKHLGGK
jgi:ABC-type dipeptide/oligopeptide/nickel transport system permease subunit